MYSSSSSSPSMDLSREFDVGAFAATEFKRFEIVSDFSDHYFRKPNPYMRWFVSKKSCVYQTIMKDRTILAEDLPDSIYVRAYKTRFDLLRAVIIGAPGTSHHNGLFFFDIVFPIDYPQQLPILYYHSNDLRLNPDLPESGHVSLSFLNNEVGEKYDVRNPRKSMVLQILLSIQGIILNDRPYFNIPELNGREGFVMEDYKKRSIAYCENAYIQSCKMMLWHLKSPPKNFERFVADHFRMKGDFILKATEAYSKGSCMVCQYSRDGSGSSSPFRGSANFMSNLQKIYPDLDRALTNAITSTPRFCIWMESDDDDMDTVEKPKKGAWKKIISAFKWKFTK